jgi:choline dehydrogenase-like flavoprotein
MFEDARKIPPDTVVNADVCIVGAGPAGISLALQLSRSSSSVCLLEAGGLRPDRATQDLLRGESPGFLRLEDARLSCFGGTTRVWSGWCRPLDESVFLPRDWIGTEGWPFERKDLDPYYERAHELCELGPFDYDTTRWAGESSRPLRLAGDLTATTVFQFSPPTRFGTTYRREVSDSPRLRVLLRAVATELVASESGRSIDRLRVGTLAGGSFEVAARLYVLAAGGIENPRLLLLSDRSHTGGVGNGHGLVGRYFMEHPYVNSGWLSLNGDASSLGFYWPHPVGRNGTSTTVRGVFTMPREEVISQQLVNCALFLLPPYEAHPALETRGADALRIIAHSLHRGWLSPGFGRHLGHVLRDPRGALTAAYLRLRPRMNLEGTRRLRLRAYCEPLPRHDQCVTLIRSRDALDRRRVRVDWEPSDLARTSIKRAHEMLDAAFRRAGLGQVECLLGQPGEPPMEGGKHHMGTTRMHPDPKRGVVDQDSRVHGVDNVFVTGSSVFPTAGYANPTLTIVALALRLADHLQARLEN